MKIAIVDDEEAEQEIVEKYLLEWISKKGWKAEIHKFEHSEQFLFHWEDDAQYDLLIFDVEMGKMNGIELARRIRQENDEVPIMFVTGYDEYMQYGYDVSALHYLIKPIRKELLFRVLERLERREANQKESKILFLTGDGPRNIQINQMMYIEADRHESVLHLVDETLNVKAGISETAKRLEDYSYIVKCHRAYLVNLCYAAMILKNEIVLDNKERIPVSRRLLKNVQEEFLRYYQLGKESQNQ